MTDSYEGEAQVLRDLGSPFLPSVQDRRMDAEDTRKLYLTEVERFTSGSEI